MSTPTARHRAPRRAPRPPDPPGSPASPDAPASPDSPDELVPDAPGPTLRQAVRRFRPFTAGLRGRIALGLACSALAPLPVVAGLWLLMTFVDDVVVRADRSMFFRVAGALVVTAVVGVVVGALASRFTRRAADGVVRALDTRVSAHVQRLSLDPVDRPRLRAALPRLPADLAAIEKLLVSGVALILLSVVQVLACGVSLVLLGDELGAVGLVAVAAVPLAALAAGRLRRRAPGIPRAGVAARVRSLVVPLTSPLEIVGLLVVFGVGVRLLSAGHLTPGVLLAVTGLSSQLAAPVRALAGLRGAVVAATAGAGRVGALLDERAAVPDRANPSRIERALGDLRIDGVTYTYPGADGPALENVSLVLRPGTATVVVGPGGAGRTTLVSLLSRAVDPGLGRVLLDDHDLRDLAPADLRRNVTMLSAEAAAPEGTVRDALLRARPGASDAELAEAAQAADVHEIVLGLPDGYDTPIGPGGRVLSAEQHHRLAIACAFLRDAPVLLLDDPTAGLDIAAAERLRTPLRRLREGRTTLVVGDDLLPAAEADQIVHLDRGRITATGRHRELLTRSPDYAQRYRSRHPDEQERPEPLPAVLRAGFPATPWDETAVLPQVPPGTGGSGPATPPPAVEDHWTVQMARPVIATRAGTTTGPAAEPESLSRFAVTTRRDPAAAAPTEIFAAFGTPETTPTVPDGGARAMIDTMDVRGAGPGGTVQ